MRLQSISLKQLEGDQLARRVRNSVDKHPFKGPKEKTKEIMVIMMIKKAKTMTIGSKVINR